MAIFKISFATQDPQRRTRITMDETLWITPPGYSVAEARESFRRQSPSSTVGTIIKLKD
jgi:hypothetical protein